MAALLPVLGSLASTFLPSLIDWGVKKMSSTRLGNGAMRIARNPKFAKTLKMGKQVM
jgi:hypothetical protein